MIPALCGSLLAILNVRPWRERADVRHRSMGINLNIVASWLVTGKTTMGGGGRG